MIDRRRALAGMAATFAVPLFAPIARAAGLVGKTSRPVISDGPPSVQVFTPAQHELMTALSERVMPTTDTPGAIAAGVPDYIDKLLADWAWPDERKPIIIGLDLLDAKSLEDNKVPGAKATPEQQDALLTAAMNDQIPNGASFFEKFRQLVLTGYFTSEIGMTQEREYLPVPGEYHGDYLYSNVNKVFSA
ncbi:MAG TPA: gluconate 2-dehydrogenase subunit 3 family protein [Sphingomonas sp.]|nr:gluconate 2-dehydrogenase subunit 3 family protein [Sphingomonas sp.]